MRFISRPTDTHQTPAPGGDAVPSDGHLKLLMRDISRGSDIAFRALFDHTADRLRGELEIRLRDPQLAATVLAATFVEVWWLAGCHTDDDAEVHGWIDRIVERRVAECAPWTAPPRSRSVHTADPRARRALLELASLLKRPIESLEPG